MHRLKLSFLLTVFFFAILIAPKICAADKVLVTIDFDFMNLAASGKEPTKNKAEGFAFYAQSPCSSDSEEGMLPVGKEQKQFPYKNIIKYYNKIFKQTELGRRVVIRWSLVNYQPLNESFSNAKNKGYLLFGIAWFGDRLNYRFRKKDGQWTTGFCLPTTFYFESPPKATIKGYGDVDVELPGLSQDISIPSRNIWNFENIVKDDDYQILINKYPEPKELFLMLDDRDIRDDRIKGKKLEILGRTTLGDSAIKTESSSFFYPFDKYSFQFMFRTDYPADVTLNIEDIQDLDLTTPRKIEFTKGKGITEQNITFFRKDKFRKFWPVLIPLIQLALYFYVNKRIKVKLWVRLLNYSFYFIVIIFAVPIPENVPKFNLLNLGISTFYCLLIGSIERYQWKMRTEAEAIVTPGNKNPQDRTLPEQQKRKGDKKAKIKSKK